MSSLKTQKTYIDNDKVKMLFEKYDLNKNGIMEKDEFTKIVCVILKDLGEEVNEKRYKQIADEGLKRFDFNKNGKIEFDEFFEFIHFLVSEKGYSP